MPRPSSIVATLSLVSGCAIAFAATLSGCGQKGALKMPVAKGAQAPGAAQPAPQPPVEVVPQPTQQPSAPPPPPTAPAAPPASK